MKKILFFLIPLVMLGSTMAQVKIMAKPGEVGHLNELGAIIMLKDDSVVVEFVMPEENRPKAYKEIDIRKNDKILMVNGKKIKLPADIDEIYTELDIGDDVKLGVRRDGDLMIITYKKADPETMPKRKMMKLSVEDDGEGLVKKITDENGNVHIIEGDSVEINGETINIKNLKSQKVKIKIEEDE